METAPNVPAPVPVKLPGGQTVLMVPAAPPAPQEAPAPVPVKLASGQTVLMVPAASAPAPAKSVVKKTVDTLAWIVWVAGLMAIAAGVACIVWLDQLWLGLKLIGCAVGGILLATWFAVHYFVVIAVAVVGLSVYIVFDHIITWASLRAWLEKEAGATKAELGTVSATLQKKI